MKWAAVTQRRVSSSSSELWFVYIVRINKGQLKKPFTERVIAGLLFLYSIAEEQIQGEEDFCKTNK